MSFTRFFIAKIVTVVLLAAFAVAVPAQTDRVLVTGRYTLRQSHIDRLTELYEWLFAGKFSPAQRRRYQTLIVQEAKSDETTAKSILSLVESFAKIQSARADKREEIRRELLAEIVPALEKDKNEANDILLEVYRNAQDAQAENGFSSDDSDPKSSVRSGGAVKVSDLAGIWSTSSVSGTRYKSLVTGELSDPSGSIIEYQIFPNGTIKHVGYLSSTVYSCTTKLFISRTGRISISGSKITFDFAPGKRMYQTCSASASRNDTLPAERKTYPFRLERDQYGLQLCTIEENGKEFCIRKKGD
jgi:hypothetical protein